MPLPETIPVKYTEEEAEYMSLRPVLRQTFRMAELVDMVLGVTGKDLDRLRQILRSGTVVFHYYRYWWQGFDASKEELSALLADFPDADPSRRFRAEECAAVLLESGGYPPRHSVEVRREAANRKRLFHSRSFWDCQMGLTASQPPTYQEYSYSRRADLFVRELSAEESTALRRDAARLAPRALRSRMRSVALASRIILICPR